VPTLRNSFNHNRSIHGAKLADQVIQLRNCPEAVLCRDIASEDFDELREHIGDSATAAVGD
jgi:hypothetical protein